MKKFISVMTLLVMALTLLTGCSKGSDDIFTYNAADYITLGKFLGVEYTYDLAEVTDEQITSYTNNLLSEKGYGEENKNTEREAKLGDTVNIDFEGLLNGVAFEGGSAQGTDLVLGSNSFIDGFEDGLVGVKPGQTVALDLTFPDPYKNNPDLAGKAVVFNVKVNHITETIYPELTDELVKEISDCETVDEYNTYANEQVKLTNETNALNEMENEIWNTIVTNATVVKYPEPVVDKYEELIYKMTDSQIQSSYGMTYEELLEQQNMTRDDIAADLTAQAESSVKNYLVMIAIAKDQDIMPTADEFEEGYLTYAKQYGYTDVDEFLAAVDEEQLKLSILFEKVMEYVSQNAVKTN